MAHYVPLPTTIRPPPPDLVAQRTAERVARSRALAEAAWADDDVRAAASAEKSAKAGAAGAEKRAARARKRAEAAKAKALADGEDAAAVEERYVSAIAAIETESAPPVVVKKKERGVPTAENSNLFTVVPATPVVEGLLERRREGEVPEIGRTQVSGDHDPFSASSSVASFPRSVRDRALADTFASLQKNGLRMGLGPRFGGEWLVYPGDYLRYHAHFTSQVIVRDDPIRPAELVAWGRLGTGTKKAGLICCWDDGIREGKAAKAQEGGRDEAKEEDTGERKEKEGQVVFYSLEWANFG